MRMSDNKQQTMKIIGTMSPIYIWSGGGGGGGSFIYREVHTISENNVSHIDVEGKVQNISQNNVLHIL